MKKSIMTMTALLTLASCGDSGGIGGSGSSVFNEVYEKLKESAPVFAAKRSYGVLAHDKAALTNWDNSTLTLQGLGSGNYNPKELAGDLLTESVEQSIFERAKMPFLISCCLDILANKTGDLFTTGSQTITFTSDVVGVCGSASDFTGMVGEEITIVVSDLADTSNYDQKIFFDHTTNPVFSDSDQWMYVRNSTSQLNFMHIEDTSAGFDGSQVSVNSISFDKVTESGFFQFATKYGTNDVKLYRIFMDSANDDARIFAHLFNPTGSKSVSLNLASTFENQTEVGVSMSWAAQNAPYNVDLTDGNACVSTTTGAIQTDNTTSCAGKTVLAVSGAAAAETAVQSLNGGTIRTAAISDGLADNLPSFNATTILSAGLGL
jgi:hypothetical protein